MAQRLRYIIVIALVVAQAITIFVILAVRGREDERLVQQRAFVALAASGDRSSDDIAADMRHVGRLVTLLRAQFVHNPRLRSMSAAGSETAQVVARNPTFRSVAVAWRDGRFVLAQRLTPGYLFTMTRERPGSPVSRDQVYRANGIALSRSGGGPNEYDPRTRPWYRAGIDADGLRWTEPFVAHYFSAPALSAVLPLRMGGRTVGVVEGTLMTDAVSRRLVESVASPGTRSFVVDDDDHVIAVQGLPLSSLIVRDGGTARVAEVRDASTLRRATLRSVRYLTRTNPTGQARTDVDGVPHFVVAHRFPAGPGLSWTIVTYAPVSDFTGALDARRGDAMVVVGVSSVATLLALLTLLGATRSLSVLQRRAVTDVLTGLPNRADLLSRGERIVARANGRGTPVGVVALDLDGFKAINDTYGHGEGDDVLGIFARRLSGSLRPEDYLCRMGGDEFMILMPGLGRDEAVAAVTRLIDASARTPILTSAGAHRMRSTAGVAISDGVRPLGDLVEDADHALIVGKSRGKGRVYVHRPRDAGAEPRHVDAGGAPEGRAPVGPV